MLASYFFTLQTIFNYNLDPELLDLTRRILQLALELY
jgi:hypothetical protein